MAPFGLFTSFDSLAVILTIVLVMLTVILTSRKPKNIPPGPFAWPVVGNLLEFASDPRENLPRLRQKYGDISSLYMGSHLVVVLHTYDVIKEAFIKHGDNFSNRPDMFSLKYLGENGGIVSASGKRWKEQRKFAVSVWRDLGVGSTILEDRVTEEIKFVLDVIAEQKGPFDIKNIIEPAISNIIFSISCGCRFQYDDPEFLEQIHLINENFALTGSNAILNILPWIRFLPGDISKSKLSRRNNYKIQTFLMKYIQNIQASYNFETPRNFVEAYVRKMKEEKGNPNTTFSMRELSLVLVTLFFAGTETTSSTIRFIISYLIRYPEFQVRIQAEIDEVVGKDRSPDMLDQAKMHFTKAFIQESQRYSVVAPVGVMHATAEDCIIGDYFIPKGAWIMVNLHAALNEKKYWGDPEVFRPSRFLDENGHFKKIDQWIPFSIGKRVCLGEPIAKVETFLFLVSLLQRFTFRTPDGVPLPDMKGKVGVTVLAPPFQMCAEERV